VAANVKLLILKHVKVLDGVHEVGPWPNGIEFALEGYAPGAICSELF